MYKPTPKQTERGLYILIVVLLIIYGIWNSEIAIPLVKAFFRSHANHYINNSYNYYVYMKNLIMNNLRLVITIICFLITLYIQHIENMNKLQELDHRYKTLEIKADDQYKKIDAIKLDKSVFEATMIQVTAIRDDIKEIRSYIKSILREK